MEFFKGFSHLGEGLALSSALFWAAAVILFRITGRTVHPLGLNFFKSTLAGFLFLALMLIVGETVFLQVSWKKYGLLILSGFIGIGISDTLLFASLNRLGAGIAAVVNSSYSPFVILLSLIFINERMSGIQLLGVLLIISAVLTISQEKQKIHIPRKDLLSGILLGTTAMFSLAVGIILMKPVLNESPLLWTSLIRSLGGAIPLFLVIFFNPKHHFIWKEVRSSQNMRPMIPGSLFGFFSLLVWMGGMKYTQASQASALNQMNTIFIFVLGAIFLKEQITKGKILALILAMAGVLLVAL